LTLVYACIAPHGSEIIERLASKSVVKRFQKTREGMLRLADEIRAVNPQTVVIASPHNLKLWKKMAVITSKNSTGRLQGSPRNKNSVKVMAKCDVEFANATFTRAIKRGLPVVAANYGTAEGTTSDMPMDWGTLVPLWFVMNRVSPKPKIVVVTPSREIPLKQNFELGRVIGRLAEEESKRIVFIASADQAHRHWKTGPYGYNRRSKEYDRLVVNAIELNRIDEILKFDSGLVEAARPDSLWQMAVLAGAIDGMEMRSHLISYEVPTYFGMICAGFRRVG
jgi:aromatic ring-opening dioxygenase LigB subunit